jgi:hypothetical protein
VWEFNYRPRTNAKKITNGSLKLTFTKSRNEVGTASVVAFQDYSKNDWRVKYSAKSRKKVKFWLSCKKKCLRRSFIPHQQKFFSTLPSFAPHFRICTIPVCTVLYRGVFS